MLAAGTSTVGNANAVISADTVPLVDTTIAQLDDYLDNLAAAATTERTTLQQLVDANTSLTASVAALTAAYTLLTAGRTTNTVAPAIAGTQPAHVNEQAAGNWGCRKSLDPNVYCWSHRYKVGFDHTSATCTNKRDGHQNGATHVNTMGGSTNGKPT
jgi:hypothetical protein